jgi:hypothetical protein
MIIALRGRCFHRGSRLDVFSFAATSSELLGYCGRAVEDGDLKALRFHVEDKIFAHDG